MGYAARYSTDIARDLARGRSFAGWGLTPAPTVEQAWADLIESDSSLRYDRDDLDAQFARRREALEDAGYVALPVEDGRYLVALPGLSAYYAETAEDAIAAAREDTRFADIPLYVFPASFVAEDQDADELGVDCAAVVEPIGDAEPVG